MGLKSETRNWTYSAIFDEISKQHCGGLQEVDEHLQIQ